MFFMMCTVNLNEMTIMSSYYLLIVIIGLSISLLPLYVDNKEANAAKIVDSNRWITSYSLLVSFISFISIFCEQICNFISLNVFNIKGNGVHTFLLASNISIGIILFSLIESECLSNLKIIEYLINAQNIATILSIIKYQSLFCNDSNYCNYYYISLSICFTFAISISRFQWYSWHDIPIIISLLMFCIVLILMIIQLSHNVVTVFELSIYQRNDSRYSIVCNIVIIIFCAGWIIIKSISQFSRTDNDIFFDVPYLIHLNTLCSFIILMIQGRIIRAEAIFYKNALEGKKAQSRTTVHELRTPLNTVILGLSLLSNEINKPSIDKADYEDILSDLKDSTTTAINILNDFLTHDKIQEGILFVEKSPIKIWKLVKTVTKPFSLQARETGVSLLYSFENLSSSNLFVSGDEFKLGQVFRNLASNALKFTPKNGTVTISASKITKNEQEIMLIKKRKSWYEGIFPYQYSTAAVHTSKNNKIAVMVEEESQNNNIGKIDSEWIRITVTDTGVGISKENQCKLFKEIIQFSPGKLQGGKGSGLGMMITKGIVDGHNGFISVHSDGEGLGTTFTVDLPLLPMETVRNTIMAISDARRKIPRASFDRVSPAPSIPDSSTSSAVVIEESKGSCWSQPVSEGQLPFILETQESCMSANDTDEILSQLRDLRCLIVDDARLNRKMMHRSLQDYCQSIVEAEDGKQALEALKTSLHKKKVFDVVLMDYHMPKMEGPVAAKCMRAIGYEGIIIGVTGNAIQTEVDNYLANGADKVMIKPLDMSDLKHFLAGIYKQDEIFPEDKTIDNESPRLDDEVYFNQEYCDKI